MDFSKYDARTAAETAQPVYLRDPATGDFINDGDLPCAVLVVGSHARTVQAGILEEARTKMTAAKDKAKGGNKKKKEDEQATALADVQKTLVEGAARVIRGFENIERDKRPLTTSAEDIEWFLDLNFLSVKSLMATADDEDSDVWNGDSFAQQILKASNNAGTYLGKK